MCIRDRVKRLIAAQPDGTGALEVIRQNFRTTPAVVNWVNTVSYTHLRAHETVLDLVCRLLLEKKKTKRHE